VIIFTRRENLASLLNEERFEGIEDADCLVSWKSAEIGRLNDEFKLKRKEDLSVIIESSLFLRKLAPENAERKARQSIFSNNLTQLDIDLNERAAIELIKERTNQEYWLRYPAKELFSMNSRVVQQRNYDSIESLIEERIKRTEINLSSIILTTKNQLANKRLEKVLELVDQVRQNTFCNVDRVLELMLFYDLLDSGEDPYVDKLSNYGAVRTRLDNSSKNGKVSFVQFYCPKIDSKKLLNSSGNSDGDYVSLDVGGNNFETTAGKLRSITQKIKILGYAVDLTLISGNTDEEDYIFAPLSIELNKERLRELQIKQAKLIETQAKKMIPELDKIDVRLWSDLEGDVQVKANYSSEDFKDELVRMRAILEGYYGGQIRPLREELEEIVQKKFYLYAKQGRIIDEKFGESILLQSEFPKRLRNKMLGVNGTLCPYPKKDSPY
jgi:hypothetical protein